MYLNPLLKLFITFFLIVLSSIVVGVLNPTSCCPELPIEVIGEILRYVDGTPYVNELARTLPAKPVVRNENLVYLIDDFTPFREVTKAWYPQANFTVALKKAVLSGNELDMEFIWSSRKPATAYDVGILRLLQNR
jgi:hypothetical protein